MELLDQVKKALLKKKKLKRKTCSSNEVLRVIVSFGGVFKKMSPVMMAVTQLYSTSGSQKSNDYATEG